MSPPRPPQTDSDWAALLGPAADAASESLLIFDSEGRVRAGNRSAHELFGTEIIGRTTDEAGLNPRHPDGRPMATEEQPSIRALATGRPQPNVRVRVHRRSGVQWLSVSAVPLFADGESADAGDRPYGVVTSIIDVTALVNTADALRRRERELELLTAHSSDLIARHAYDGTVLQATGRARELLGIDADQLVGLQPLDVCHPDDAPRVTEAMRKARRGEPTVVAYRVRHQQDQDREIWLESTISPIRASDGRLEAVTTSRDITARKEVEERLRKAEEEARRQKALLEEAQMLAKIGSWAMDLSTMEVWSSDNLSRMLGIAPTEENLFAAHQRNVHPDDREVVETAQRQVRDGKRVELTYRLIGDDGTERIVLARSVPGELDERGRAKVVWGVIQDVTDLHELEAGRREAERRFRAAFEHAPIGVAIMGLHGDDRGRWLNVNPALTDLLGYSRETLLQGTMPAYIHPDDLDAVSADIEALAEGQTEQLSAERRMLTSDGQVRWVLTTVAAVTDEDGRPAYAVLQLVDITERKRFEGQLQYLADHDPLTGLFNRRRFEEELERVLAEAERYGRRGAVMVIDLDGFKYVNDTLGHPAGDRLISRLASTLRGELRETDVIARLGGDEFGLILPEVTADQAMAVADKLLAAVERDGIVADDARHARVTASAGLATFEGGDGLSAEELLVEADIAMYDSKEAGRNRATVTRRDEPGQGRHVSRLSWLERIRRALVENRFELYAQPILAITGDGERPQTFELLLRMRTDAGELIPPATFLHVAERFDLIQEIDRWVVTRAADILRAEHAAGQDIRLSVNLSGKTMGDAEFAGWLENLLIANPVPADRLILEITETAAIVNLDRARALAETLGRLGCLLALDDFGAGFASFSYLKHLRFDVLKIDGEFVRGLRDNATDRLVVEAVVAIARGLGKPSLAEFVADGETLDSVKELGVDFVQGFHLGRPMPIEEALAMARR
jgi:diguanylate cyclase (GGDEF)-like protein/PAS domain S-box-containing protein